MEKYRELIDNGNIFQPVALEVQGSFGESSEIFITRLCKKVCRSHDDQRAGSFLKQLVSMALQIGNVACVLGTVSDRDAFEGSGTFRHQPFGRQYGVGHMGDKSVDRMGWL